MYTSYVFIILAIVAVIVVGKTATVVPQQSAYVIESARQVQPHAAGRLSHPDSVRRARRLPAQPQGAGARRRRADLHHARQRAGRCRRGAVHAGARSAPGLLRHHQLRLRHRAAGADDAAQRDRQDRARSHLRGARHHQRQRRGRARQGLGRLGREGDALRDQEHHAAQGRAVGDGKADARRAREARRGADLRGRARRQDQRRPRATSSASSRLPRPTSSSRSTRRRARPPPSSRWRPRPPRACAASAAR